MAKGAAATAKRQLALLALEEGKDWRKRRRRRLLKTSTALPYLQQRLLQRLKLPTNYLLKNSAALPASCKLPAGGSALGEREGWQDSDRPDHALMPAHETSQPQPSSSETGRTLLPIYYSFSLFQEKRLIAEAREDCAGRGCRAGGGAEACLPEDRRRRDLPCPEALPMPGLAATASVPYLLTALGDSLPYVPSVERDGAVDREIPPAFQPAPSALPLRGRTYALLYACLPALLPLPGDGDCHPISLEEDGTGRGAAQPPAFPSPDWAVSPLPPSQDGQGRRRMGFPGGRGRLLHL